MNRKKYFVIDIMSNIWEHDLSKLQPIEFRKDEKTIVDFIN
jgi:hypothetical protein